MIRFVVGGLLIALALLVFRGLTSPLVDSLVISRIADGVGKGTGGICDCDLSDWRSWPVIFSGKVFEPSEAYDATWQISMFEVDRVWRAGEAAARLEPGSVITVYGDACPPRFDPGRRYLVFAGQRVFASEDDAPPYVTLFSNTCMPSRRWRMWDELLLQIGLGDPPKLPLMVPGQLRRAGSVGIVLLGVLWIVKPWWIDRRRNGGDREFVEA